MPPTDSLDAYLDPAPKPRNPRERVHSIASRIGLAPDLADDYLKVTQIESGHNPNVRDSPKGAQGFGQVMPDRRGGSTRTVGGRSYNLRNPDENIEAGLRYFAEGGSDPTERRLYYFGGPKARERYRRTGRIPNISDGNLTAAQYVAATGGRSASQSQSAQPQSDLDRYLDPQPGQTPPPSERQTQPSHPLTPPKQSPATSVPRSRQGGGIFSRREVQEAVRRGVQRPTQSVPIEQALMNLSVGVQASTDRLKRQAQRREPTPSPSGIGDLRRVERGDEARTQRLLELQREEQQRSPLASRFRVSAPARRAAQRLSAEEADTARRRQLEPEVARLTDHYRKQIRQAQNRGIGPEQWLNETAAKGVAGLLELGSGVVRGAKLNPLATGAESTSDRIAVHAEALQRAAEAEGVDRNYVSQATQNILAGTVSTAPEMVATSVGIPAPLAFGAGGATRSLGRGERPEQIAQSGLHGAATGAVFEIPAALGLQRPLAKVGTIGVGTGAVEAASGQPLSKAIEAGATNALLAGAGEIGRGGRRQPSSLARGLEREAPRERVEADAEIAARLRGERARQPDEAATANAIDNIARDTRTEQGNVSESQRTAVRENVPPVGEGSLRRGGADRPVEDYLDEPQIQTKPLVERSLVRRESHAQRRKDVIELDEAVPDDVLRIINRTFNQTVGPDIYPHLPERPTMQDVVQLLADMGLSDQVINQSSAALRQAGYRRIGDVLITEEGLQFAPKELSTKPPVEAQREAVESPRAEGTRADVAELPEGVVGAERLRASAGQETTPSRFYHRDFGEVTESPNQRRVGKGRVRVIDEAGREHVVRRPSGTGAGNQRAVEIRETPERQMLDEPVPEGYVRFYRVQHETGTEPSGTHWATDLPYVRQKYGSGGREAIWSRDVKKSDLDDWFNDWRTVPILTKTDLDRLSSTRPPILRKPADVIERGGRQAVPMRELATEPTPERIPEIRVEGEPPPRTVTEPVTEPPPPSTTAAKRASMSADRAALDLPEFPPAERKSWQETLASAKHRKLDERANRMADEVLARPRALTDEETAGIVLRAQQVKNEHAAKLKEIADATDGTTIQARRAELETLEREFDQLTQAAKASGTEKGRALAAQKLTINQDYDLVSLVQRAKARKGRELTPEERQRYEQTAREITENEATLNTVRAKAAEEALTPEVQRLSRQRKSQETRQRLDDEYAQLKADFAQAKIEARKVQASGLAALDPEGKLTKLVAQMARNRIRAGINSTEALIRELYETVKERGWSREDVVSVLRNTLHESDEVISRWDRTRQTNLLKQEAELQRRLVEKDYSKLPPRAKPIYSREVRRLEERVQHLKNRFDLEMERARPGHFWRQLSGIRKSWMLSGLSTQVKNIAGTGGYQVFDEIARFPAVIADAALAPITGQRTITQSPAAMLDSVLHAVKTGGREAGEIMRLGATKEQLERHQFSEIDTGVKLIDYTSNLVFRFMSASDRVFWNYAYKRNLNDRALAQAKTERAPNLKERVRELTEKPSEELDAAAKHDALVATFNNNNSLSTAIKGARAQLGPKANFAIDLVMPFDRTPTNVIARIVEASPAGAAKASYNLIKAAVNRSLTPEQQRQFSQTMGRSTAGTAIIGLGWALGDDLLEVDEYKVTLKLGGYRIDLASVSPIGNLIALGARLRDDYDKGDKWGAVETLGSVPLQQPLIKGTEDITGIIRKPKETLIKGGGRAASSFVPFGGAVRDVARATDKEEGRYARSNSFRQQVEQGIPGLRQRLPITERPQTRAERWARGFARDRMANVSQDAPPETDQYVTLRTRARRGEDVSGEVQALSSKLTDRQVKSILAARNRTRLQEDVTRLGIKDALLVYSVANSQQRAELKDILTKKANLVSTLPPDEQAPIIQKLNEYGLSGRGIRITRPARESRASRPSR